MAIDNAININPARCPICNQANHCAMLEPNQPSAEQCWCHSALFSSDILKQLNSSAINKACICQNCLQKWQTQDNANSA